MTLTAAETKTILRTAMNGWLAEIEHATPVVSQAGAMCQFVAQIPPSQPKAFALAYVFVSEDEPRMIELHRRLSSYIEAGLPEMPER